MRENAHFMGFSETFIFFGGVDGQFDQEGGMIPVLLAITIAQHCLIKKIVKNINV